MEAVGVRPDTYTFTTLLDGYCRNGQLDKAEALLAKMEDSKPTQRPSTYTYNIFIKACASKVKQNFYFAWKSIKLLWVIFLFFHWWMSMLSYRILGAQFSFPVFKRYAIYYYWHDTLINSLIGCIV